MHVSLSFNCSLTIHHLIFLFQIAYREAIWGNISWCWWKERMSSIRLNFFPRCVFYIWQGLKTNTKSCSLYSGEQARAQRISQGVKHLVEKQAFPFTVHTPKNVRVVKTMEEGREDLSPLITEITRQICWALNANILLRFLQALMHIVEWATTLVCKTGTVLRTDLALLICARIKVNYLNLMK